MIRISLSNLILLGMVGGMALVCLLWVISVWKDRRRENRRRRDVILCRICGSAYPAPVQKELSRCPMCQTPNERTVLPPI